MISRSNVWLTAHGSYASDSVGTTHTGKPALFTCMHTIDLITFTRFTNSYEVFTSASLSSVTAMVGYFLAENP